MRGLILICKVFIFKHNWLMICAMFKSKEWMIVDCNTSCVKANAYLPISGSKFGYHIKIHKYINKYIINKDR